MRAQRIVIATGSRPDVPAAWRAALGDRLIVNDDVFDWTDLPRSVAVVGAGVIGLELAQALHRLGVRVRLYGRSGTCRPAHRPGAAGAGAPGVRAELPLSTELAQIEPRRDGDEVVVRSTGRDGSVHEERFDWLLAATGRRPNVDQLGLEHTTLPLDADGHPGVRPPQHPGGRAAGLHRRRRRTRIARCCTKRPTKGRIAGDNAGRFPDVRMRPRRAPLAVVFSDPQIALAGASHAELVRQRRRFRDRRVSRSTTRAAAA